MKYPGGNTSTLFCEQVGTVTSLFEQWNDCERTVVLYALLKRVPFANLKFLQHSIECNMAQNFNSQTTRNDILEKCANDVDFLTKVVNTYKNFNDQTTTYGRDLSNNQDGWLGQCAKKGDILSEVLAFMPLLKPGNAEAKAIYLSLIPLAVDDSIKNNVPTDVVQQMLSYLLIHPAVSCEDRRTLAQWLRHLEDFMANSFTLPKATNGLLLPYDLSSSNSSLSTTTSWQAIAPPQHQQQKQRSLTESPVWDLKPFQLTSDFCDEVHKNPKDDLNISFSKNGTEILDYECEEFNNRCNTQIAFDLSAPSPASSKSMFDDFLTIRRSNSLTTTSAITPPNIPSNTSSSTESLLGFLQKPRSLSLPMDSTTPSMMKIQTYNAGMANIGQWLKSLRLHKYIWLFTNITYEQMLDINEEYLESVGITKGARNKFVLCIQKLKERSKVLTQYKKEILSGGANLNAILEDVLNMVLTPMKPCDPDREDDVAGIMLQIIDLVGKILTSQPIGSLNDEDCITNYLSILDKAMHSEGFTSPSDANLLKEYKCRISKMKLQFASKNQFAKNTSLIGNGCKPRWNHNNTVQHKPQKFVQHDKIQRRNSISNYNKLFPSLAQANNYKINATMQNGGVGSGKKFNRNSFTAGTNNRSVTDKENGGIINQWNVPRPNMAEINSINSRLDFLCLQMTEQAIE